MDNSVMDFSVWQNQRQQVRKQKTKWSGWTLLIALILGLMAYKGMPYLAAMINLF